MKYLKLFEFFQKSDPRQLALFKTEQTEYDILNNFIENCRSPKITSKGVSSKEKIINKLKFFWKDKKMLDKFKEALYDGGDGAEFFICGEGDVDIFIHYLQHTGKNYMDSDGTEIINTDTNTIKLDIPFGEEDFNFGQIMHFYKNQQERDNFIKYLIDTNKINLLLSSIYYYHQLITTISFIGLKLKYMMIRVNCSDKLIFHTIVLTFTDILVNILLIDF